MEISKGKIRGAPSRIPRHFSIMGSPHKGLSCDEEWAQKSWEVNRKTWKEKTDFGLMDFTILCQKKNPNHHRDISDPRSDAPRACNNHIWRFQHIETTTKWQRAHEKTWSIFITFFKVKTLTAFISSFPYTPLECKYITPGTTSKPHQQFTLFTKINTLKWQFGFIANACDDLRKRGTPK